ncbi:MAG: Glucose-1-phosphate thymidyltransferase [Candidatus Magasanikbacteria bacterium GW2011_GWA2_56_11]|uniref:Glucose-1-phosphate thymidyltransferase n=1 Tax=Candidatus Magasanikbacteria bacterium GW2011_GWA2_56_11 TaxID=1619044 RepID=A0A0G1YEZ5_9BACT|nr:MAG: Glucose-1-phosphate thymidyltransferase [Candidatus Magasanikbacteria bacterium GW2011_GWA2_56_11]
MKLRKAVLTGGGRATRLYPITTTINKHLLPLANKPMIFHAIEKAVEAGVTEIFINTNPGETELQKYIGDGGHWGVKITFFEQTGGPQGVAHIAKVAERFIGRDPFLFYFSDNVLLGNLKDMVDEFHRNRYDLMLAFSRVDNPEHFGIPLFDDQGKIQEILEKPQNPPNNLAQTGIILYGPGVFFEAFNNIRKSARGEYEISDVHSYLIKNNYRVGHREITGWWKDTGQPRDILVANQLLLEHRPETEYTLRGDIHPNAKLSGQVQVGTGSQIGPGVTIRGPVIIAENCLLEDCAIGPHVTIGAGTEIRRAKIEHSIILDNCEIDADMYLKDSLIGKKARLVRKPELDSGRQMIMGDKTIVEV